MSFFTNISNLLTSKSPPKVVSSKSTPKRFNELKLNLYLDKLVTKKTTFSKIASKYSGFPLQQNTLEQQLEILYDTVNNDEKTQEVFR